MENSKETRLHIQVPREMAKRVRELARKNKRTLCATAQIAFELLLASAAQRDNKGAQRDSPGRAR